MTSITRSIIRLTFRNVKEINSINGLIVRNGTTCLPYPPAITFARTMRGVGHEGVFEAVIRILHLPYQDLNNRVPISGNPYGCTIIVCRLHEI
jgi:hypothetical protein